MLNILQAPDRPGRAYRPGGDAGRALFPGRDEAVHRAEYGGFTERGGQGSLGIGPGIIAPAVAPWIKWPWRAGYSNLDVTKQYTAPSMADLQSAVDKAAWE